MPNLYYGTYEYTATTAPLDARASAFIADCGNKGDCFLTLPDGTPAIYRHGVLYARGRKYIDRPCVPERIRQLLGDARCSSTKT